MLRVFPNRNTYTLLTIHSNVGNIIIDLATLVEHTSRPKTAN